MRILWISFLGSWTKPLLNRLINEKDLELGLVIPNESKEFCLLDIQGLKCYGLGLRKKDIYCNMDNKIFDKYYTAINDFKPDIIHIHGTEKNLAQVQNFIKNIPVIISVQGIMSAYHRFSLNYLWYSELFSSLSIKNIFGKGGVFEMKRRFKYSYKYEEDIFKKGQFFLGRTSWDRAKIVFKNPNSYYFTGEELLRNIFYDEIGSWSLNSCKRRTIFMPSGFNVIKGLHWAVEVVALLRNFYPDIKLTVPGIPEHLLKQSKLKRFLIGESYINFILKSISKLGLQNNIHFLPHLNDIEMANEMKNSHVFLSPTSIDNSPNVVGEASMIGMPIVITPVGGVTSFMKDGENCLFSPAGDPYYMALQIKRIFDDDSTAYLLSNGAVELSKKRHDKNKTTQEYIYAYKEAIRIYNNSINNLTKNNY